VWLRGGGGALRGGGALPLWFGGGGGVGGGVGGGGVRRVFGQCTAGVLCVETVEGRGDSAIQQCGMDVSLFFRLLHLGV
jgi:hypothetical protein